MNGLIIQWVSNNGATGRNYIDLPISFSNTNYYVIGGLVNASEGTPYARQLYSSSKAVNKVTFPGTTSHYREVFAIGY